MFVWYIDYDRSLYVDQNSINKDPNHQRVAVKEIVKSGANFKDFAFVNGGGKSGISGIYNVVFDGKERACFTPDAGNSFGKCPEESSSSAESSSSVKSSSSAVVALAAAPAVDPRVRVAVSGRTLEVFARVAGEKNVRLFDMQGNLLCEFRFAGESLVRDLSELPRGAYSVLVYAGNSLLERVRVVMR